MAVVNMREMLRDARRGSYALGAFNILDYNSMRAVVDAAVEFSAPVIIQTSVKTVTFWGYEPIIQWYRQLAGTVSIPIVIHLDHCKDLDVIRNCIKHGWTSVMIDASSKPFAENLAMTQKVVEMASAFKRSVALQKVSMDAGNAMIFLVEKGILPTAILRKASL